MDGVHRPRLLQLCNIIHFWVSRRSMHCIENVSLSTTNFWGCCRLPSEPEPATPYCHRTYTRTFLAVYRVAQVSFHFLECSKRSLLILRLVFHFAFLGPDMRSIIYSLCRTDRLIERLQYVFWVQHLPRYPWIT